MAIKNHTVEYRVSLEYADTAELLLTMHTEEGWEESTLANGSVVFRVHTLLAEEDTAWHEILTDKMKELCNAEYIYSISEPINWIDLWKDSCTPVEAGEFYIVPEWYTGVVPANMHPIYITPKMAFGTGHHQTTALCLELISEIKEAVKGSHFLDIGTGSGILSIACALYGAKGVAIDIDSVAIENAQENIINNHQSENIEVGVGDIYSLSLDSKYTIITANILAKPLQDIAEAIALHVNNSGYIILSGLLTTQIDSILEIYTKLGFSFSAPYIKDEWGALLGRYSK